MKAGRELDALVAERVMGQPKECRLIGSGTADDPLSLEPINGVWRYRTEQDNFWERWSPNDAEKVVNELGVSFYSTDIAVAEKVVNHMAAIRDSDMYSGYQMEMRTYRGAVIVRFMESPPLEWMGERFWDACEDQDAGHGDTISHTICLAALKALNIPFAG